MNENTQLPQPAFTFIPATETDQNYLLALRKLTMVEHLERNGVYLTDKQHLERVQYNYHQAHLIQLHRPLKQLSGQLAAPIQNTVIGMLKYQQNHTDLKILQLQIHPDHQNKGYGKAVMQQILRHANTPKVSLTVLKGNPAIHLYKRLGFEVVGEDELEYWMVMCH